MSRKVLCVFACVCALARTQVIPGKSRTNDGDYNTVNTDGSFDFGYSNKDVGSSYHIAHGNANRVVGGRFGAKDPATGTVKETVYTAGPRGFRAKGPHIHRKMDLDQRPRGPIGNKDDPYFDPNEDPSYAFNFNTRTYSKTENADSRGDVKGQYSYVDDVGERHDVSYIAGRDTGFHVSSANPDSPSVIGSPFHRAPLVRGELKQRGRTAVQRGLDGSYRFISAGPDQRRTESSDSRGNVRGSYSFLDDKGVQRTVHYIAGPGIGYRIVKNSKDPYIPPYFPTIPSAYDPDFVNAASGGYSTGDTGGDDIFKGPDGTAASGHVKPPPFPGGDKDRPGKKPGSSIGSTARPDDQDPTNGYSQTPGPYRPGNQNHASGEDSGFDEDASYPGPIGPSSSPSPTKGPGKRPIRPGRPTSKPFGPTKKPYVPLKPFQKPSDDYSGENGPEYDKNGSQYDKNGSGYDKNGSGYDKNGSGYDKNGSEYEKNGPDFAVGFDIKHEKPGTTIIRNIGQDYFGVPPGVSVRAHVQSIDLYPYESKPISPSEAIEKDKT